MPSAPKPCRRCAQTAAMAASAWTTTLGRRNAYRTGCGIYAMPPLNVEDAKTGEGSACAVRLRARARDDRRLRLLLLLVRGRFQGISLGDFRFELVVGHVVVRQPMARHV